MFKYLTIVLILIFAALAWMYFGIGVPAIYSEKFLSPPVLHTYTDSSQSIKEIKLYAFYFIPRNKTERTVPGWQDLLGENLEQLKAFHSLQFQNRSHITYDIYPEPVVGLHESLVYDTEVTQNGNPYALLNIAEELEARAFDPSGDLFISAFTQRSKEAYPILFIMYEGVGASGGIIQESDSDSSGLSAEEGDAFHSIVFPASTESVDGFFLLNREFLAGVYGVFGTSFLGHEFYHTLGIPDAYMASSAIFTSPDIMGSGRRKPLEKTYLENKTLKKLGL